MSVGCPGSYRGVSWRARYSPELVADLLPFAVWGVQPERTVLVRAQCSRTEGKCRHTCAQDQWGEGCVVDGKHRTCYHRHGGHDQCGQCVCISPELIRSRDVRESDGLVMLIDVRTAWERCRLSPLIATTMALYHGVGLTQVEIAERYNVTQQSVSLRVRAGHMALADWLNGA